MGGYGQIRIDGKRWRSHRLAYVLSVGPIPSGLLVLHRCDNPPCCNPAHLFIGSQADNINDMVRKGRNRRWSDAAVLHRGERCSWAKLTADGVREIRTRRAAGELLRVLAMDFGISEGQVCNICHRRTWKHVA